MDIKNENLQNALIKILALQPKCPICGGHDLGYTGMESQILSLTRTGNTLSLNKEVDFLVAIPLTCKRCGYILQFDLSTILGKETL